LEDENKRVKKENEFIKDDCDKLRA
jgi:chromosome segregation ATPase